MNNKNTSSITEPSTTNNQDLLDLLGLGGGDVIPTSTITPAPLSLGVLNGNDITGLNVNSAPAPMLGGLGTIGGDLSITNAPSLGDLTISNQPTNMVGIFG